MLVPILHRLLNGQPLDEAAAETLMGEVMEGRLDQARLGAMLAALRLRGPTAAELSGFARAMRARAVPVATATAARAVDTCGTGGDGRGTFNISTAAALVTAAAGVPVAKHGNRAASSRCGSADVLEALGRLLDEIGIAFMFAQAHHPAMRHAVPVRRALGVHTVFNLLGPLTNPAGVRRQLLGVYASDVTTLVAATLRALGCERALVVHGHDGQDEFSLTGETAVVELRAGQLSKRTVRPEDVGMARCGQGDLSGGHPAENARLVAATLAGEPAPRTDAVLLNAAGALYVAGAVSTLTEGVALARAVVQDGRAVRLLARLVEASHDLAAPFHGRLRAGGDA